MAKRKFKAKGIYPPVVGFDEKHYSTSLLLDGEIWKTVPLFDGEYEASNYGRLRSKEREIQYLYKETPTKKHVRTKILRCVSTVDGYLRIVLKRKGSYFVHRIVALTWLGKSNLQIDHINGDKKDNRVCNLEYVTALENIHRAVKNNLLNYPLIGQNNASHLKGVVFPLLDKEQVIEIRRLYSPHKYTIKMLTQKYNCSEKTIRDAIKGRNAYKNY